MPIPGEPVGRPTADCADPKPALVPVVLAPLAPVGFSEVLCDGATCWPLRARGFDIVWSIPGVFRIDGLSARGLNKRLACGAGRGTS